MALPSCTFMYFPVKTAVFLECQLNQKSISGRPSDALLSAAAYTLLPPEHLGHLVRLQLVHKHRHKTNVSSFPSPPLVLSAAHRRAAVKINDTSAQRQRPEPTMRFKLERSYRFSRQTFSSAASPASSRSALRSCSSSCCCCNSAICC